MHKCIFLTIFYLTTCVAEQSDINDASKSKNPLPYFRRQVEEITEDGLRETRAEDSHTNIVSFLVKNLKEIFDDVEHTVGTDSASSFFSDPTHTTLFPTLVKRTSPFANITTISKVAKILNNKISKSKKKNKNKKNDNSSTSSLFLLRSQDMRQYLQPQMKSLNIEQTNSNLQQKDAIPFPEIVNEAALESSLTRTCIDCNNVLTENCADPNNKIIPTIHCERDSDVCSSLHTPFGIVRRGCYNVNHNLITYVCSCNLCNHQSISELPYSFQNMQEWVENVIELSRLRSLRKTVLKDFSCLRCEANKTTKLTSSMDDNINCIDGNIGALPIEYCKSNELCGVKVVRSDGYIWRGCLKAPRYNYWITLCDADVCNLDELVSIYSMST